MSVLVAISDSSRTSHDVADGPLSDIMPLLDHLVSAGEHGRRQGEVERLGGLEINYQLVLGRRLHWKVDRLLALEDAIDVGRRPTVLIAQVRPIGDQAAVSHEE